MNAMILLGRSIGAAGLLVALSSVALQAHPLGPSKLRQDEERLFPAASEDEHDPHDSGGVMLPEQAAYDVLFYDLAVEVLPEEKAIRGRVIVEARIGSPLSWFVLDLDPRLTVGSVALLGEEPERSPLELERRGGRLWIVLPRTYQPGERLAVEVAYGGKPREARNAPWDGGVTWAKTPSGAPWIATTCQGEGADIWWPVKDHVSDEPDSMALHIRVPKPLVAASNGRLERVGEHEMHRTYHWKISTPINAYNVALNIAPYEVIEASYQSVTDEAIDVFFWVLPESLEQGREALPEFLDHLRFHEELLGPYPFRADKYGIAQTPHLGMEHQTIVAYGADFDRGAMTGGQDWGFDALHHHELSHEWWGNMVTNAQWSDMWIHEGFGTYMQPLYIEARQGEERYHAYMASIRRRLTNRLPLADRGVLSSSEIYGGDIYFKGAWVLHTLRYLIGDEAFYRSLRRMAYPTPELEATTDGTACRFVRTIDFHYLVESIVGQDLDWFFDVYVRQPKLPELVTERAGDELRLHWETPGDLPFPMPVEVGIEGEVRRVEVPAEGAAFEVPEGIEAEVDPMEWILRE